MTKQMAAKQANVVKYDPMASANFPQHISAQLNFMKKELKTIYYRLKKNIELNIDIKKNEEGSLRQEKEYSLTATLNFFLT